MGVPAAPFDEDAWIALGVKRALLDAARGGYEGFMFPSSRVLSARYSDRARKMYEIQYDQKMPSIIKKLTGQTPRAVAFEGRDYYTIDFTPELIAEINDTGFSMFQDETEGLTARGSYRRQTDPYGNIANIITLLEGADLSTFLHESAHFWMYQMRQDLDSDYMTEQGRLQLQKQWDTATAWFEKNSKQAWSDYKKLTKAARKNADAKPEDADIQRRANLLEAGLSRGERGGGDVYMAEIARNFMNGSVEESGTLEIAFHELWARAGERYLAEGKAPSATLRPLFASFSSWMTHIYRNLGRLNVTLDEDIRGVFDRLLATEEAINAERQREAYKIPREVRDLANDNELADIERLVKDAELEAQQQMQLVVAEEIDELNSQERKAAEEKAREEISKEVYKEPAYAAIELSRRGVLPDGTQLTDPDGKPTKIKLFREEFVALFGVDAARAMPRGMLTKNAADATDISTVAMLAGFSSQDEMVATLKVSRVRATDAINQRVKLRMDEEFPQLTDPAVAADRAAEVVLNEKQLELAQLQARILQRKVRETIGRGAQRQAIEEGAPPLSEDVARIEGVEDASGFADTAADAVPEQLAAIAAEEQRAANIPQRKAQSAARRRITTLMSSLDMEAVRLAAADYIDRALVSDLTPQRYIAAAERLSRKVSKAIASRDYEEAMVLLEQKALNLAIAKQARDAQKKINGLLKRQKALLRRSDKKLANGYDLKILNAGRAVMERLGVAVVRVGRLDVDEVLEDAAGAFVDPAALTEFENKVRGLMSIADAYANKAGEAYRDMPYGIFLQVAQEVQSIVTEARSARSLLVDGKRITHETIVAEMSAQTADRGRVDVKAAGRGTTQQREHITKWGTLKAASTRVESWARAMDSGRPDGPFNTYIIKPVFDAITTYYTERRAPLEALVEVLRPLAGSLAGSGTIAAPELDGYVFQNKAELLHAILHTGNESNKSKLLRAGQVDVANEKTYQWAPPVEKGSGVDTKQWDAFMARMYAEGIITKADMDAAQRVWNIFKETKGAAQKAHYRMFGFYFVTIEDSPVVTPFGTYPGGYVPAVTDKMMDIQGGARVDADNLASQQNASMFPNAEAGFTKARVESYAQPLELDILRIPAHLDRVMKFAYLGPTVREVAQLVTGAPFRSMMNRFNRFAVDQLIIPWLQRTVRQSVTTGDASRGWSRGLTALSNRVGMQVMAGNIVNAAQQLTGISSAAVIVPPKLLMKHLFHYKEDGVGIREFISQHSGYMDVRFRNGVSDMMQEIETILTAKTRLQRGQEVSQRYAYFAQQATQNLVDPVVWMAAFDHAKELGVWQRAHDAHNDGTVDENGVSVAVKKADAAAAYYADSVVRQTQSPMGPAEVSRIETGIPLWRIIMKFYGYFNSMLNLVGAEADTIRREVGYKGKAGRFFYLYLVGVLIPSVVAEGISIAARGKFDEVEDDDELAVVLAELFLLSQIKFAAAMIPAGGAVISRVVGQFTPATYDDRLSFSPVISIADNALGGVLRLGKDTVMGLSGGDTRDASQIVRDGLNAVGIWIGLPTNWFSKPIQYLLKVEEGKADPENVADYVEGFLTGRDGTKR